MGDKRPLCEICEAWLGFQWSDSHGVGVCIRCGLPYRIIHYDENNQRVENGPEVAIKSVWLPVAKRYWNETKGRTFPGSFDMGISRGRRASYSGATQDDINNWMDWIDENVTREELKQLNA